MNPNVTRCCFAVDLHDDANQIAHYPDQTWVEMTRIYALSEQPQGYDVTKPVQGSPA